MTKMFFIGLAFVTSSLSAQVVSATTGKSIRGVDQRDFLNEKYLLNNISFRNAGPSIGGGRVVDIAVNEKNPIEFYVAYASGGLWYTNNNGQFFTSVFDSVNAISIGAIAVDWKSGTILVGTGEASVMADARKGIGVFKSTDKGKTWTWVGLKHSYQISKILIDPLDINTIWVAVLGAKWSLNKERGVYKTTDGGISWKQVLFVDNDTGAVDMAMNPQQPGEIYAAMWYKTRKPWNKEVSGKQSGIYKTSDGGGHWQLITKEGSGFLTGKNTGRIGLAIYPANPNILYAAVDNSRKVYNFSADGEKWFLEKDSSKYDLNHFEGLTREQFLNLDEKKIDQFLREHKIKIDSSIATAIQLKKLVVKNVLTTDDIYNLLGQSIGAGGRYIGTEVYKTDNGGRNWHKSGGLFDSEGWFYFGKIYISPNNSQKLFLLGVGLDISCDGGKTFNSPKFASHADSHALWVDPSNDFHILVGNDGGCYMTYDYKDKAIQKLTSPPVAQAYSVAVDNAKPYNVYCAVQDNGSWVGPSTIIEDQSQGYSDNIKMYRPYPYKKLTRDDGTWITVDTSDNIVYACQQFGDIYRIRNPKDESADEKHLEINGQSLRRNWRAPVILSSHNQDILYYGLNKLFRSFNRGDSFSEISPDLTKGARKGNLPFATITAIAESPFRFGLLYVGTDDGNVQFSKDGGVSWKLISQQKKNAVNLPQDLRVSSIVASRYKGGRVYVTLDGFQYDHFQPYVFSSEDYGETWKQLGLDLPYECVNVIKEDPKNDSILYVGTEGGLYVSFNRGSSFMKWSTGLPSAVLVTDIAIQERENDIVLATYGRSIYIASLTDVQGLAKDPNWLMKKSIPQNQSNQKQEGNKEKEEENDDY